MKRTGKRYRPGRAAAAYDSIVIGSGIGGLCCAALLSRLGQKVCVLEQHYTAGGFTHSYEREGYEWDVGVHYVGEVHKPHSALRRIFDVVSDGRLQWAQMDPVYDRIVIGGRRYDFVAGRENFRAALKQHFPDEAAAIDAYLDTVQRVARSMKPYFAGRAMPPMAARLYEKLRRFHLPRECFMSTREVLEKLTANQELIAVLTGQWGDYGLPPADSAFLMHASVVKHFIDGGCYPVGGSWKIADSIIPTIQAGGGEVFTYARVRSILVEDGRATGVEMEDGSRIAAQAVISNAGARLTFGQLLPQPERGRHGYPDKLTEVRPSASHLCLYAGFKGSARELGLPRTNLWIYPSAAHEQNLRQFFREPLTALPMVYVSFPSAKDPEWERQHPDRSTVEIITLARYDWFAPWARETWNQRGEDYDALKQRFTERLLDALYTEMPQLRGRLDYSELSTPLSTQWFQLNDRGEIYGLDHDLRRFEQRWLHPVTPVRGLYLTGQDVVTAGVGGALLGGVMTAAAMQGRHAGRVFRMLKQWQPPEPAPT